MNACMWCACDVHACPMYAWCVGVSMCLYLPPAVAFPLTFLRPRDLGNHFGVEFTNAKLRRCFWTVADVADADAPVGVGTNHGLCVYVMWLGCMES